MINSGRNNLYKMRLFLIFILILIMTACSPNNAETSSSKESLPILQIKHSEGGDALLDHELTPLEQKIFQEMNAATSVLPKKEDSQEDLQQVHQAIIPIGKKYGLSEEESVAFWTRTAFGILSMIKLFNFRGK